MTLTGGLVGRFLGSQVEPYSEEPLWPFQCLQPRTHPTPTPLRLLGVVVQEYDSSSSANPLLVFYFWNYSVQRNSYSVCETWTK